MASFSACQRALLALDSSRSLASSFLDLFAAFDGVRVGFLQHRLALDFQLHDAALDFVNFGGQGIDLHAQAGGGFVDQVDGFIGQKTIGDVAVRKRGGGKNSGVLDAHAVVHFIALFQAAKNRDGVFHRGLGNQHGLEAALERGIFLDVFFVFVERGGADGTQFAARQCGL